MDGLVVECESCEFTYSTEMTPTIESVTPTRITGPTNLTIYGTGFGDVIDDVFIQIADAICHVNLLSNTMTICEVQSINVGNRKQIMVNVAGKGRAQGFIVVHSSPSLFSCTPKMGSLAGGTIITLRGNGFIDGQTTVLINDAPCATISTTLVQHVCKTGSSERGSFTLDVTSRSLYPKTVYFDYNEASTPTVSSINPTSGPTGSRLEIRGVGLTDDSSVQIGGTSCEVESFEDDRLYCILGSGGQMGEHPLQVSVPEKGLASTSITFTYQFEVIDITSDQGKED